MRCAVLLYMVGMDDLQHIAIAIEATGDPSFLTHRKQFLGGIGSAAKIGERADIPGLVLRKDTVGAPLIACRAMLCRGKRDNNLLALARFVPGYFLIPTSGWFFSVRDESGVPVEPKPLEHPDSEEQKE